MKKASKSKSRGCCKVLNDLLFLHKLQSTDNLFRLHRDEVHAAVQTFKVERGHTLGVALLVDLLSQAVEYHDFAVFLRQVETKLALVGIGIEDDAIRHCFLRGHDDFGRREDDVVQPSTVAAIAHIHVFEVSPFDFVHSWGEGVLLFSPSHFS